jgi:hypothetical protein
MARQEEITPELLRIIAETVKRAPQLASEDHYMAHLFAMFLLAQFREVRAYPLVVQYASLPPGLVDALGGDFNTGDLGRVLASVCGGDLSGIASLIEGENIDQWVRGAAVSSLATLVAAGQKSRQEVIGYFAGLFRGKLERRHSHVWDELASVCADLSAADLIGDIEQAYEEDLIDPGFVGFDEIQRDSAKGEAWALARLAGNPHRRLVFNTVEEMEWWAAFEERHEPRSVQAPVPRAKTLKVGRNDPCPCGSGKKYKKCCGG